MTSRPAFCEMCPDDGWIASDLFQPGEFCLGVRVHRICLVHFCSTFSSLRGFAEKGFQPRPNDRLNVIVESFADAARDGGTGELLIFAEGC